MPKATVNKHGHFLGAPHEVRSAENFLMSAPTCNLGFTQKENKAHLRGDVSLAANA